MPMAGCHKSRGKYIVTGDNSPSISKDDIENWLYPIPPIAEQKRIVIHVQKALEQTSLIASSLS